MSVTIGLPFSNQDAYLEDAIKSVFLQSHRDWELILVADGASARCLKIARLAAKDSRVRLIVDSERRGLAARLNQIAKLADSEFLFRMDADDIMCRDRLEKQVERLLLRREDVIGSRAYGIDGRSNLRGLYRESPLPELPTRSLKSNLFTHPTVAGRTQWFRDNPYNEMFSRAEDKELWLRVMNKSVLWKSTEPLLYYRLRIPMPDATRKASSAYDRRSVIEAGRPVAGLRGVGRYVAGSHLKDAVYALLSVTGRADSVQERKFLPLPPQEVSVAATELRSILDADISQLVI